MIVGVPRETLPGERRVAVTPHVLGLLAKAGLRVLIEPDAGLEAGFPDHAYLSREAHRAADRADLFKQADVILQVRALGANPEAGQSDIKLIRPGQAIIGLADARSAGPANQKLAATGATVFALDLMPRITRAQSMDVLSSQATIGGYKAVLLAAQYMPKIFPMMMTAAGTLAAAHAFVIGAGVAGLQAIATARRLGGVVEAYDIRPAVRDQVQSVGAKFVELPLEAGSTQTEGGYAKALGEEFYRRQRELMRQVVARNDVVITTAAVPGKKAPVLITGEMVEQMMPGSVIVDLAAERGGNCELSRPDETVTAGDGVTVLAPTNLPATVPYHASQMFARNVTSFLTHLVDGGELKIDLADEITRETLVARDGKVVHGALS